MTIPTESRLATDQDIRNLKFQGFAKLLFEEQQENYVSDQIQIIARRAYDLVFMAFRESQYFEPHDIILTDEQETKAIQRAIAELPDLAAWSEEREAT